MRRLRRRHTLQTETPKPLQAAEITEKEVILLGLIAEEPIHAYGLEEKIRFRQMEIWTTIGFSSIYRVLSRLEDKGLIDTHLAHQGQGATRKVHQITEKGKRALAKGVLSHLASARPVKSPFSVGLANITRAPYNQVASRLKDRIAQFESIKGELGVLKQRMLDSVAPRSEELGGRRAKLSIHLLFNCALSHFHAEMDFMTEALKMLEEEGRGIFEGIREEGEGP